MDDPKKTRPEPEVIEVEAQPFDLRAHARGRGEGAPEGMGRREIRPGGRMGLGVVSVAVTVGVIVLLVRFLGKLAVPVFAALGLAWWARRSGRSGAPPR